MKTNKNKLRIAELERQLVEANSQLAHVYHFASANLHKAGMDKLTGSGVILTLTALGGRVICDPVMIRDGLSPETIATLKADFIRSYDDAIAFTPK